MQPALAAPKVKITGAAYPFWEKPFLGEPVWKWYLAAGLLAAALLCSPVSAISTLVCCTRLCLDSSDP